MKPGEKALLYYMLGLIYVIVTLLICCFVPSIVAMLIILANVILSIFLYKALSKKYIKSDIDETLAKGTLKQGYIVDVYENYYVTIIVDGKPYRYTYLSGNKKLSELIRNFNTHYSYDSKNFYFKSIPVKVFLNENHVVPYFDEKEGDL